ncbi:AtpZ/AtpI family protein [Candidatus Uhrbacteria bacterium]|nr:AtpZ/AtpI family protein [Candidatus Uhrbacteria bacterium]
MSTDAPYYRLAMKIFVDFTGTIAIPVVVAALAGKWLDERYGTSPWSLIGLFALALIFTGMTVVKKAYRYRKEFESISHNAK